MKILDQLTKLTKQSGIDFLLIGGHAVNVYGDRRQTADVDLLICEKHKQAIKKMVNQFNYDLINESSSFLQFKPDHIDKWPLDFLMVDENTFDQLLQDSNQVEIGGEEKVSLPSIKHLIALKLHALKQAVGKRRNKDLFDIITLIDAGNLLLSDVEALCQKYATEEEYKEIVRAYDEE